MKTKKRVSEKKIREAQAKVQVVILCVFLLVYGLRAGFWPMLALGGFMTLALFGVVVIDDITANVIRRWRR